MNENVWLALSLTALAGISTGIGSLIAIFAKRTDTKLLSAGLGFSAGVMIYVSMVEILPQARKIMSNSIHKVTAEWLTLIAFLGGMILIGAIDKFVPSAANPHEVQRVEGVSEAENQANQQKLMRMGLLVGLAVAIHNFPEGLATFVATLQNPALGLPIAIAIAIHNIPEGIAVAIPIFYATGNRVKAFSYSFFSGISEPIGALIGYLLLMPFLNDLTFGLIFAAVAGIMIFISLDELLPAAREYGEHHLSIYGVVSGMAVMAVSLILLG